MKWFLFILLAAAAYFWAQGYRFHPGNIPYYLKFDGGPAAQIITFADGKTMTGQIIEETGDTIKLKIEGAVMAFRRTQIISIKSADLQHPLAVFKENYEKQKDRYPLVTYDKAGSLFDKSAAH